MNLSFINDFFHELRAIIKDDIKISINKNSRVFIYFNPKTRKLSLHKLFLCAPKDILEALCNFIIKKKDIHSREILKRYITSSYTKLNQLKISSKRNIFINKKGNFYDLDKIYKKLNKEYFNDILDVNISWFGRNYRLKTFSRTLGVFHHDLKLIRIHKCLDCSKVPEFFIEYIVYHEMLHYFFPITFNSQGRRVIHSASFKERERCYSDYLKARLWEKNNRHLLFN